MLRMEDISLSETERRYYSELFLSCDEEETGKIPLLKASELYHSANISDEKILEISSLAGIPDSAYHVSRIQFYSCLKLIAAHQASLPLRQELIAASIQLPLPRFDWTYLSSNNMKIVHKYPLKHVVPPTLKGVSESAFGRNSSASQRSESTAITLDMHSTDSEIEQGGPTCGDEECLSAIRGHTKNNRLGISPEAWSTNSDSPTPTNSVAEHSWKKKTLWHGLLGDEHRQLLGTEEESSDRHSSDDENEANLETVYQITSEQREYYFKQFKAVQHDPNDLLSGHIARVFFEKSRIPIEELRHIWQLCDVSRDGALSLAEFTAAMHLVVLRRNNIPLPEALPACLHPNVLQHNTSGTIQIISQTDPPEADLLHLDDDGDEDNTDNTIIGIRAMMTATKGDSASIDTRHGSNALLSNTKSLTPPMIPPPPSLKFQISSNKSLALSAVPPIPPLQPLRISNPLKATEFSASTSSSTPMIWTKEVQPNQWTQFSVSPTSNVSSPGPKPVNFDMQRTAQAVVSDPQILHPVPLRVTPIAPTATDNQSVESYDVSTVGSESSPKFSSMSSHHDSLQNNDLRAIQRPQPKKITSKNTGAIPPPPQRDSASVSNTSCDHDVLEAAVSGCVVNNLISTMVVNKKDHPPLPPPRPHRHGRSSSLDLNKFKIGAPNSSQPELIPQASFDLQTTTGFADFAYFSDCKPIAVNAQQAQQTLALQSENLTGPNIQTISEVLSPNRLSLQSYQRVSAFEVYRKPNTSTNSQSPKLSANEIANTATAVGSVVIPTPFGLTATTITTSLPNSKQYEKKVNAINETLRQVSFKQEHNNNNMIEVLRYLREQNNLLLRICNDLNEELLTAQTRKDEMRLKLEAITNTANISRNAPTATVSHSVVVRRSSSISAPATANIGGSSGSVDSNA